MGGRSAVGQNTRQKSHRQAKENTFQDRRLPASSQTATTIIICVDRHQRDREGRRTSQRARRAGKSLHIGFAPDCQTYLRICGVKADVAYASGRRISLTRETPDSLGSASLVPFPVERELQMAAVDIKQADGRTRGFCKRAVAIAAEMSVDRFARIPCRSRPMPGCSVGRRRSRREN